MSEEEPRETATFLVSILLPDPVEPNTEVLSLLEDVRVHLLGSYVTSEQISPEQARDEFGDDAKEALAEYEDAFLQIGKIVSTRLVFTPDVGETLERLEAELDYDAIFIPRAGGAPNRILVALTDDVDFERVVRCVGLLLRGEDHRVTLLHMAGDEEDVEEKELMLTGLREKLADRGVPEDAMTVESVSSSDPVKATSEYAENFDLIVLADKEPTIKQKLFGEAWQFVADEFDGPVILVKSGG